MALLKDSWPIWPVPCHHKSEGNGEHYWRELSFDPREPMKYDSAGAQGAWWYMVHKETANQFDLLQIVTYPGASVIMWYTHLGRERRWTESNIASATKRQQSIASKPVWSTPDRHISWGHSSLPDTSCMLPPDLNSTQPCLFHFC